MSFCKNTEGKTTESANAKSNVSASKPPVVTAINSEYINGTKISNVNAFVTEYIICPATAFAVNALTSKATDAKNAGQKNRKDVPDNANTVTVANNIFQPAPATRYSVAELLCFLNFFRQNHNANPSTTQWDMQKVYLTP